MKHGFIPHSNPIDLVVGSSDKQSDSPVVTVNQSIDVSDETSVKVPQSNAVQTRAQVRKEQEKVVLPSVNEVDFDFSSVDVSTLQREDVSLKKYFQAVQSGCRPKYTKHGKYTFFLKDNVLYRSFSGPSGDFCQLIVPQSMRPAILSLAHDTPFSGHLAAKRTLARIQTEFFWPGITRDVKTFCRTCPRCQKTKRKGKTPKAPLQSFVPATYSRAFEKVSIDLMGPIIPASDRGNRYILMLIDFTTRWAECVALKEVTTEVVAEALLGIFSRIGFPSEVLSDRGPQFVSGLMKDVMKQLGIKQVHSTPYHPQSNGLVERINGTIKQMLNRIAHDRPKDWDRYLQACMYAYREVPQETTGFSPFELVYGQLPRGPMTIAKELCTNKEIHHDTNVTYQYVVDLKNRLSTARNIANTNTKKQFHRSKEIFDRKAKQRLLKAGDLVLVFLPIGSNKIANEWKGPHKVLQKLSDVNYLLDIDGRHKAFHINMLQKYHVRPQELSLSTVTVPCNALSACVISDGKDEPDESIQSILLPNVKPEESINDVIISDNLSQAQKLDVSRLIVDFREIFTDIPGSTVAEQHDITVNSDKPVKIPQYPLPFESKKTISKGAGTVESPFGAISPPRLGRAEARTVCEQSEGLSPPLFSQMLLFLASEDLEIM